MKRARYWLAVVPCLIFGFMGCSDSSESTESGPVIETDELVIETGETPVIETGETPVIETGETPLINAPELNAPESDK